MPHQFFAFWLGLCHSSVTIVTLGSQLQYQYNWMQLKLCNNNNMTECTKVLRQSDALHLYFGNNFTSMLGFLCKLNCFKMFFIWHLSLFQGHVIKDCCPDKTVGAIKEVFNINVVLYQHNEKKLSNVYVWCCWQFQLHRVIEGESKLTIFSPPAPS